MPGEAEAGREERRRVRRFFDRVAPLFPIVERHLAPLYVAALETLALPPHLTVLDLGTGTGALAAAFAARGHPVTGIDTAERLLRRAARRLPTARFEVLDLFDLPRLSTSSFEVVSLGYVLHGLPPPLRRHTLLHARRLASRWVVVVDYSRPGPWYVRLVERLEGPHYQSFLAQPLDDQFVAPFGLEVARLVPLSTHSACWALRPVGGAALLWHRREC